MVTSKQINIIFVSDVKEKALQVQVQLATCCCKLKNADGTSQDTPDTRNKIKRAIWRSEDEVLWKPRGFHRKATHYMYYVTMYY